MGSCSNGGVVVRLWIRNSVGFGAQGFEMLIRWIALGLVAFLCLTQVIRANYLGTSDDAYPWTKCNHFEATKKNCPRGEKCLKMNRFTQPSGPFSYAWNWAMRCQSREEFIRG